MPMLQQSDMFTQWDRIVGGVYTYIEKILAQFNGQIYLVCDIKGINRQPEGISHHDAKRRKLLLIKWCLQ